MFDWLRVVVVVRVCVGRRWVQLGALGLGRSAVVFGTESNV